MSNLKNGLILPKFEMEVQVVLNEFSEVLEKMVKYGSHLHMLVQESHSKNDLMFHPIMLFRQFIELLDSVSILIRQGAADPCKPILRTMIESSMSIEYIIQSDFEKRSKSYTVVTALRNKRIIQKVNEGTAQAEQFKANLKKDLLLGGDEHGFSINQELLDKEIATIDNLLNLPQYQETYQEYLRNKEAKKNKEPEWYSLYEGPENLDQLALRLRRIGIYEVLYRYFSGYVHCSEVSKRKITRESDGLSYIHGIRDIQDAQQMTIHAINLTHITYSTIAQHILSQSEQLNLSTWYITNIRDYQMKYIKQPRP